MLQKTSETVSLILVMFLMLAPSSSTFEQLPHGIQQTESQLRQPSWPQLCHGKGFLLKLPAGFFQWVNSTLSLSHTQKLVSR